MPPTPGPRVERPLTTGDFVAASKRRHDPNSGASEFGRHVHRSVSSIARSTSLFTSAAANRFHRRAPAGDVANSSCCLDRAVKINPRMTDRPMDGHVSCPPSAKSPVSASSACHSLAFHNQRRNRQREQIGYRFHATDNKRRIAATNDVTRHSRPCYSHEPRPPG